MSISGGATVYESRPSRLCTRSPRSNHAWINNDNPLAAADMVARIRDRISFLEVDGLAQMGRPGLVASTRELIEYPYIIVYRVDDRLREVDVLATFMVLKTALLNYRLSR